MKQKLIKFLIALAFTAISADAAAQFGLGVWDIGTLQHSADVKASLSLSGTLTISGTRDMRNWTSISLPPWHSFIYAGIPIKVVIEDGVTSIGDNAFAGCTALTSITIPNSVTSIGENAFADCAALPSVTIPNSVTSIGANAFAGCPALTSVTMRSWNIGTPNATDVKATLDFSGTLTIRGTRNMMNWNSYSTPWYSLASSGFLLKIVIEDGVTNIGDNAFADCHRLTSVTIPESVTNIGKSAFKACHALPSVTIPESVTSIEESTFDNCNSFTSVTIPNNVENIGKTAFRFCGGLTSVVIPNSVKTIGERAFSRCRDLTYLIMGDNVESVGKAAFEWCSELRSGVSIPNSVKIIEDSIFYQCNLTSVTIPNSVTSIGKTAFYACDFTSVVIPNNVKSIGERAFYNCTFLTSVTVGNSVESIGGGAFSGEYYDSILEEIIFLGDKPQLGSRDLLSIVRYPNPIRPTFYYPNGNETWKDNSMILFYADVAPWGNIVSFNIGDEDNVQIHQTQTVADNDLAIFPINPKKNDYAFTGWYNGESEFDFNTPVTEDITLTAKWLKDLTEEYAWSISDMESISAACAESIKAGSETVLALNEEIAALQQQLENCGTATVIEPVELSSSLSIYPNPTNGLLTIDNEQWEEVKTIEIYSLGGTLAATKQITGKQTVINISQLPAGNYIVKVGKYAGKLIKE